MKIDKAKISDRANGPVVPVSYKGIARKRSRANGGEAPSVSDFLNEQQRGQTLEISLKNLSQTDSKTIAIFPGMLESVAEIQKYAGAQVDAIAVEGDVIVEGEGDAAKAVVTCTSKTLNLAKRWINKHPMRFCRLHLQNSLESVEAQWAKEIKFYGFALGKTTGDTSIRPQDYVKSDQYNRNIVDIDLSMQLDDNTVMVVELAPKADLSLSLQVVTEMNDSFALTEIVNKLEA